MNKYIIYILIFLIFLYFLTIVEGLYIFLFFNENNLDFIENDYCQKNNDNLSIIEKYACDNKYKKSKFIWIALDGFAYDLLYELKDKDKYNILNLFKVIHSGLKLTGPIHETQLTGTYSTNRAYNTIKKDNLFVQINNIDYHGLIYPYDLFFNDRPVFNNKYIENNFEDYSLKNFCDLNINLNDKKIDEYLNKYTLKTGQLKNKKDIDKIYKYFDDYFSDKKNVDFDKCFKDLGFLQNNKSFLYYTDNIDHINHYFFKYHKYNIKNIYAAETFIKELFKWIDNNPDYVLIISSDHGGIEVPLEEYFYIHGNYKESNSAIFLIYTKEFKDKYNEWKDNDNNKKINLNDISSTIAQILKGVNIPLENEGFPKILGDDKILRVSAIKSKEFQLINFIEKYQNKYNKKIFNKILNKINTSKYKLINDLNYFDKKNSNEYFNFLKNIQNEIFNLLKKENKHIYFQIIMIFIFLMKLSIDIYIFMIEKLDNQNKKNEIIFKILICFILCFESFYCLININNKSFNSINFFSKIFSFFLLASLSFFYYKKNNEKNNLILIYLLFICLPIFIIFYKYRLLVKINEILFFYYSYQYFICSILLIFSFVLLKFFILIPSKKYFIWKEENVNLYYIFDKFNIIFHLLYFIFQFYNFNYAIVNFNLFFEIIKYCYYLLIIILSSISCLYFFKKSQINDKIKNIKIKKLFFLFKIIYYYYFLIFSNPYDKIVWIIFIYPLYEIFYNKYKKSNNYFRIIIIIFFIFSSNIMYENSHFYYGLHGMVLNNKNRRYLIPIIFSLIYRNRYFFLCAFFLLSISKISKKKLFLCQRNRLINKILMICIDSNIIFYCFGAYQISDEDKYSIGLLSFVSCNLIIYITYNIILLLFIYNEYMNKDNFDFSILPTTINENNKINVDNNIN